MEALELCTVADLLAWPEERVELIDGEIVRRPMARGEHGVVQGNVVGELQPLRRSSGPGGWWIATEISVAYEAHQCPSHDLAGWRKARMPERPRGVVELTPDWVCEIVSPGHERKDTLTLLLLLQRHRVPYYWLIWPEDRTLVVYALDGDTYRIVTTLTAPDDTAQPVELPPFEGAAIDLGYILGG
ncbi:MAG: Uma2 family endonuclease [Thiohalocapsa sp.]|jgi:Uma2 family endonuclease|uniref:Uma2 family endonuclease n=1 Tax=Thiohalocapsa sp. TaxID=2497641 RepID=UPI0025CB8D3B|nr:Uma2 family endonuclease [Thiohalocapsa sp.]MCG6941687.1 Uma2 family endonuclease [Thiohalocapsa sp.]